jgi:5-methylthioadenosine/S-adenosylhomocysteine deaminase
MASLITGAKVLSADAPYSFSGRDVLVSDAGIIEKVAPSIQSSSGTERIDAGGKIILPGLINTHTHAAMSLLRGTGDDLHLAEWLQQDIWPREKKMTAASVKAGALLACAEMIRSGTTCFNDMYFHMEAAAAAVAEAGMRAVLGYGMIDMGDFEGKGKKELVISEKFASHVQSRKKPLITSSIAPHATNTCSKELLQESAKLANKLKIPLHVHAAETRNELADVLAKTKKRPIDFLDSCGCLSSRSVVAHGVYASKSEVLLLARRSSSLVHCPVSNLKLAGGGAAPIPECVKAGVNLGIGTDGAASNNSLSLLESMKVGAIEQKNFRFDAAAVKADDYLHMATAGGAKALGIKAGKIAQGYMADLVLLDSRSPNLVPFTGNAGWLVYSAGPQNVTDVMVNGKWLMRNRELLTLDEEKILAGAQKAADELK